MIFWTGVPNPAFRRIDDRTTPPPSDSFSAPWLRFHCVKYRRFEIRLDEVVSELRNSPIDFSAGQRQKQPRLGVTAPGLCVQTPDLADRKSPGRCQLHISAKHSAARTHLIVAPLPHTCESGCPLPYLTICAIVH